MTDKQVTPEAQAAARAWIKSLGITITNQTTQELYKQVSEAVAKKCAGRDAVDQKRRAILADERRQIEAQQRQASQRRAVAERRKFERAVDRQPQALPETFSKRLMTTITDEPVAYGTVFEHCIGKAREAKSV